MTKELARYKTVTLQIWNNPKIIRIKSRTLNIEEFEGDKRDLKDTLEWLNEIETDKMDAVITEKINCIANNYFICHGQDWL